jgi:hypothetical protein
MHTGTTEHLHFVRQKKENTINKIDRMNIDAQAPRLVDTHNKCCSSFTNLQAFETLGLQDLDSQGLDNLTTSFF